MAQICGLLSFRPERSRTFLEAGPAASQAEGKRSCSWRCDWQQRELGSIRSLQGRSVDKGKRLYPGFVEVGDCRCLSICTVIHIGLCCNGHPPRPLLSGLLSSSACRGSPSLIMGPMLTALRNAICWPVAFPGRWARSSALFPPVLRFTLLLEAVLTKTKAGETTPTWQLVLWALDNVGLSMLYRLVSRSEMYYKPRIDKQLLAELIGVRAGAHCRQYCLPCVGNQPTALEGRYQDARAAACLYWELLWKANGRSSMS